MSNKLGGKQGTAYLGTNADQPPNWVFAVKDPTQYDVNNVSLGDLWLNEVNENVWVLVSLKGIPGSHGSLATWAKLESGGLSALNTLAGNTWCVVDADSTGNINVVGDGIALRLQVIRQLIHLPHHLLVVAHLQVHFLLMMELLFLLEVFSIL